MKEIVRSLVVRILTLEALFLLRRHRPRVVMVTGSVGKTSTKDATFAAFTKTRFVRRSEKSYNSDIGAPLAVLGLPNGWNSPLQWVRNIIDGALLVLAHTPYPEWLIVEVGADRPGDITRSLTWLKPEVVIATHFPAVPVHVEFYDSPRAVVAEELAPLTWLSPGGVAVINGDDGAASSFELPEGVERITYGFSNTAAVRITRLRTLVAKGKPTGISFDVSWGSERAHVSLSGVLGAAHATAVAAGIAAAVGTGMSLEDAVSGASAYEAPPGRMRIITGTAGITLIDDSYNASPAAVLQGLEALRSISGAGKRIAVLGDMLELGAYSIQEHVRIGKAAAEAADILITVGVRARGIAAGALEAGMSGESIAQFERGSDAATHLAALAEERDVLFIKGSQGMRMERVVRALMADPSEAAKLLCRQDPEWMLR